MAKQTVNIGASANDGTGDTIREAFNKVNDNFTEVYDNIDVANSVVTDTSPRLGGDLDVAGFSIVANTGTGIINIVPSTAGYLRLDGIKIDGTTITTHTNNTNITLDPHGTGKVLAQKIAFTGGTIDGVTIGATQPPTGTFDVLTVNTALQATGGSIDNIMVGSTTPSTGAFTSLEASELTADLINMAGHIIPTVDVTRELGSNAKKWAKLYVDVINANSINLTGTIAGTFSGNVTGDVTGDLFGNADTATALQTARNINGVSFDGTSDITVTADANTLTNTTLKSTVVNSSLTSVGTLTGLAIGASATINLGDNVVTNVATPLANKDAANKKYVDDAITGLVDGAVPALDTLKELAESLNNDADIATTIVNGLAAKLDLAGGTMTGSLYLNADPVGSTEAATKNYVDNEVSSAVGAATTISSDDTSVVVTDDGVVDGKVEITVDGNLMVTVGPANISAESHRIVDVTDPSGPQDAATKNYVDDQIDALATVATSGAYGDLSGTPTLALVATSGSFTDLSNTPDLVDIVCDSVFANNSLHTAGSMECESLAVKNYAAIGDLGTGSLSRLDIEDDAVNGVKIQQVKNNLLDINSAGTLALSSGDDLTIQGLVYPSADGTAGQMMVTDGAGALSFATPLQVTTSSFTGTIAGTTLTVTGATPGTIAWEQSIEGPGVAADTFIISQLTGTSGGNGTYSVTVNQNVGPVTMNVAALFLNAGLKLGVNHAIYQQDEDDTTLYNFLIGIEAQEATIHIGDINTNGVCITNDKEYKVHSALNPGTYMAVAKVDSSDNVILASGNSASTLIRVGGDSTTAGYGLKLVNGGEALIPVGLRIGDNTNYGIFQAPLEISSILGAAANNQSSPAGASLTTYRGTGTVIANDEWGSYLYGARFRGTLNSPLPVKQDDWLMEFGAIAFDGTNNNGGGEMAFRVDGAVTSSANPSRWELYVTPAGTNAQTLGLKVDSNLTVTTYGRLKLGGAVPAHSYGAAGDKAGMFTADATYFYYCTADYVNNTTNIWKRTAHAAGTW